MNTLQSSLYVVAIVSCLLCAFVVGGKRAPKRFNFLIAYLVLESLRYVFQWLMLQPAAPAKSLWFGSLMISSLLVAAVRLHCVQCAFRTWRSFSQACC